MVLMRITNFTAKNLFCLSTFGKTPTIFKVSLGHCANATMACSLGMVTRSNLTNSAAVLTFFDRPVVKL